MSTEPFDKVVEGQMVDPRWLKVTKQVIRAAVGVGLKTGGTIVLDGAWGSVEAVLTPVFTELQRRYPKIFLAEDAAELAATAIETQSDLQAMLQEGIARLDSNDAAILNALARADETLEIMNNKVDALDYKVDTGFRKLAEQQQAATRAILSMVQELWSEIDMRPVHASAVVGGSTDLSIDEIYNQAATYQYDSMNWISSDSSKASQELAQARELINAGLAREPENSNLLASIGFVEKTQAQVSLSLGKQDEAVDLLVIATKYFIRAVVKDRSNVSAANGFVNIYLFLRDYDRAIKLGTMIVDAHPEYGAAAVDLSLAYEGKLEEVGSSSPFVEALISLYRRLEKLMERRPEAFPADYLPYVRQRLTELSKGVPDAVPNVETAPVRK